MRDATQLALLSAAVVVSLIASVAQGYHLSGSSSSSTAATAAADLLRYREHQCHRCWSPAQLAARDFRHSERGWVVGGGTGLPSRGSTGGVVAFGGELRMMMMAESGAPPAKKGKGKGPYKVIANNK